MVQNPRTQQILCCLRNGSGAYSRRTHAPIVISPFAWVFERAWHFIKNIRKEAKDPNAVYG